MYRNPELEEIRTLLHTAGIRYRNSAKYFQVRCPYHDDHTPSALVYKDNGFFKCYSCATERSFARFYKDMLGVEWDGKLNLSLGMIKDNAYHEIAKRIQREKHKDKPLEYPHIDIDTDLKQVRDVPMAQAYCESRGMEESFIEAFGIKAMEAGRVNGAPWKARLIIPFEDGGIIKSVEGRDYTRQQTKKVLYPKDTSVDFIFNASNLNRHEPLIVVEGVMDVHKIWQWITPNVTCTFGINLRERQKEMLLEFGGIVLFIDDDEAGRLSIEQFEKFYPYDFRVTVSKGKDPGDSTREELEKAIENAKPFNVFLMEDSGLFPKKQRLSLI